MAQVHLTPTLVAEHPAPESGKVDLFDTKQAGLLLEVRHTGGRTFYVRYRNARGKTRQLRLSSASDLSLAQARQLAQQHRSSALMGDDPAEAKAKLREISTLSQFFNEQYMPYVLSYKKTATTDECLFRLHIAPTIGKKYLDQITKQDIIKVHGDRLRAGAAPGSANRLLILMRYTFNLAMEWGVQGVTTNPTTGVKLFPDNNKKERYLKEDEPARLYAALEQSDNPMLKHIVAALLVSGARKREVLDAKWEDFDLINRRWRIPTTKAGKPRYVPIGEGLSQVLANLPRVDGCPYAFANPKTGLPFVSIYYSWDTARKQAGLGDVRMHDLRHSFASFLVNNGRSLYEVQRLLGHTTSKVTQRYAHLAEDTLRDAANSAYNALDGAFTPRAIQVQPQAICA